jgi:CDP-diacylglycerol--glycerol-3-phosphate 3-phosphatidyltransferase
MENSTTLPVKSLSLKSGFIRNLANIIVLLRTLLVFVLIYMLSIDSVTMRLICVPFLASLAIFDWFDGYIARMFNICSKIGGLIDTLGDRITENVLLIYFACVQLVPVFVPLFFVSRSFVADLIRHINFGKGHSTFSVNISRLGYWLVASAPSRTGYLVIKIALFVFAGIALTLESAASAPVTLARIKAGLYYGSITLVVLNLLRFIMLIYDSREIIVSELMKREI